MKNLYRLTTFLTLATAAVLTAGASQTVTFTGGSGYGPYQTGRGGEFTLKPSEELSWVLPLYSDLTSNVQGLKGTFQTFCVEGGETISPYATYFAEINDHTELTGQPLTAGAAWLYQEFATGQLEGYDYSSRTTAGQLQNALWWLMGNGSDPNNTFSLAALDELGGLSEALAANDGKYDVGVLSLWTSADTESRSTARQDQLVLLPPSTVPDAGTTASLLSLGFGSLVVLGRLSRRAN